MFLEKYLTFRNKPIVVKIANILTYCLMGYCFAIVFTLILDTDVPVAVLFSLVIFSFIISFLKCNDPIFLLAQFITIFGDIFLMIFHKDNIGFPIYILVQLTYAIYFYFRDANILRRNIVLIIRIVFSIVAVVAAYLLTKENFNHVSGCAIFYFANILMNLVCAAILKDIILVIGFTIFAISDLVIGLRGILPDGPFKDFLNSRNFIHIFYMPSQTMMCLKHKRILISNKSEEDVKNLSQN